MSTFACPYCALPADRTWTRKEMVKFIDKPASIYETPLWYPVVYLRKAQTYARAKDLGNMVFASAEVETMPFPDGWDGAMA